MRTDALLLSVSLAFAGGFGPEPRAAWGDDPPPLADQASESSHSEGPKRSLQETEAGDEASWLQFRVTEKDLGKITASRCEFVFPNGIGVPASARYVTKDGFAFVANNTLFISDRAGKLVSKVALDRHHFGGDWFVHASVGEESPAPPVKLNAPPEPPVESNAPSDPSPFSSGNRFHLLHADGRRQIGAFGTPQSFHPIISRDLSRIFYLERTSPDGQEGPVVVDAQSGNVLKRHDFLFGCDPYRLFFTTKDGLVVQEGMSGGFCYIGSSGHIEWRSPLHLFYNSNNSEGSPTSGKYVLAYGHHPQIAASTKEGERARTQELTVFNLKGQAVLKKSFSTIERARILPDEEHLLLTCHESGFVQQLYRLKDGRRLWSVPATAPFSKYDLICASQDGARLAFFTRTQRSTSGGAPDGRFTFTIAVLDLATGAELLSQELPFREKVDYWRQPRWTDARTIELIPADYLYRIRLKF